MTLRREEGDARAERPRGPPARPADRGAPGRPGVLRRRARHPRAARPAQFLGERGFDQAAAEQFGIGFAPRDGESLLRHLRQRGFTDEETVAAGLVAIGRSAYDRFRGRLLWPIRESSGDTIGFGARRIFDDDRIEAKYLNTPETPIYKKSQVLYGIDLARREMARSTQAVVVEGYTDVMACHLAGVGTAVATCGTAFGDDHARVLRRFLNDHEEFRGEVIFTFDGDAAGQKAALRAFGGDQNFVSQTYVAVEPTGLDPCDLRLQQGDAAVRELVARRLPLYRFVLANVVKKYDLDRADGRVDAVREAAGAGLSIRDTVQGRAAFARELAAHGRRGHRARPRSRCAGRPAVVPASARVPPAASRRPPAAGGAPPRAAAARPARPALRARARDPQAGRPGARGGGAAPPTTSAPTTSPTRPTAPSGSWSRPAAARPPPTPAGSARLRDRAPDHAVRRAALVGAGGRAAAVAARAPTTPSSPTHVYRLQELTAQRRIAELKSRLQRTNPVEQADRLQPDVRRAGRPRAAPPRSCATWPLGERREALARAAAPARPPTSRSAAGRAPARLGATRRRRLGRRHPRRRSTCRASGCPGSRSRPPTGTATTTGCASVEVGTVG